MSCFRHILRTIELADWPGPERVAELLAAHGVTAAEADALFAAALRRVQ
jgi:hypothetical protein